MTALQGCVTATVQQVREANTGMGEGDSIVVLGRRDRPSSDETELNFIDCVSANLGKGGDGVNVIDEADFRDAVFPWFEPRTAPVNTKDLPELMATPVLAQRLREIGLRYLVWIDGSTVRTDSGGSMTCSVTTAGAGCFGFLSWENDSSYEASSLGHPERQRRGPRQLRRCRHQLHAGHRCAPALHCPRAELRLHEPCRSAEELHHQRLSFRARRREAAPSYLGVISTTSPVKWLGSVEYHSVSSTRCACGARCRRTRRRSDAPGR